jgi:uncharacterized protein (DUF983 family)
MNRLGNKEGFDDSLDKIRKALKNNTNDELVDVIASGYEWECPACGKLNKHYEHLELVTCEPCGLSFHANPPEHCFG